MPNINGTNGSDNIDVTDDVGTLNGTPQGTPINKINAKKGDDTITITNSTITGNIGKTSGDFIYYGDSLRGCFVRIN